MRTGEAEAKNVPADARGESDVRLDPFFSRDAQGVFHRIGNKWSISVLALLVPATLRFHELREQLPGISQRSLSLTLHALERDGLVERVVYPVVPPHVDYFISPLGRSLIEALASVATWCEENGAEVQRAHLRYDGDSRPGLTAG